MRGSAVVQNSKGCQSARTRGSGRVHTRRTRLPVWVPARLDEPG